MFLSFKKHIVAVWSWVKCPVFSAPGCRFVSPFPLSVSLSGLVQAFCWCLSLLSSFFFFLSQHRVTGDLCWSAEAACRQQNKGCSSVLFGFWCWLASRPLRLQPNSRTGSSGTDKGVHSLQGGGVGEMKGASGDEESKRGRELASPARGVLSSRLKHMPPAAAPFLCFH